MKPFRAIGWRFFDPPRVERHQCDVDDLTTFSSRPRAVRLDARGVAPPREFWTPLSGPVPGRQLSGTLPADPYARFVLRMPTDWNGGVVVAASPGLVSEFSYDLYWSDFCLSRGFAFAATDKGVRMVAAEGATFLPLAPINGIEYWLPRLKALTLMAKEEIQQCYGQLPERTIVVGLSNGGYLTRRMLESHPDMVDGGVDVSGVMWRSEGSNLLEQLPAAIRACRGDELDVAALVRAGYKPSPQWLPVIKHYRGVIWETVLCYFIGAFDPDYTGKIEEYRLSDRPEEVRSRIAGIENTGDIGKPLVSVYGECDPLVPAGPHAQAYSDLVRSKGKSRLHRVVAVAGGSHNDHDRSIFPFINPVMPAAHAEFEALSHGERFTNAQEAVT